jgi:hypothetical protein
MTSFCLFVILSICHSVYLSFCLFVILSICHSFPLVSTEALWVDELPLDELLVEERREICVYKEESAASRWRTPSTASTSTSTSSRVPSLREYHLLSEGPSPELVKETVDSIAAAT